MTTETLQAGDPSSPEHEAWLLELGRATYAASRLAGVTVDILRVHGGDDAKDLYDLTHGRLLGRLEAKNLSLPGIMAFLDHAKAAVAARNDLLHALPVAYGLHRRRASDLSYVADFYDVESVRRITERLLQAAREGNKVLYSLGQAAIDQWYANA